MPKSEIDSPVIIQIQLIGPLNLGHRAGINNLRLRWLRHREHGYSGCPRCYGVRAKMPFQIGGEILHSAIHRRGSLLDISLPFPAKSDNAEFTIGRSGSLWQS